MEADTNKALLRDLLRTSNERSGGRSESQRGDNRLQSIIDRQRAKPTHGFDFGLLGNRNRKEAIPTKGPYRKGRRNRKPR